MNSRKGGLGRGLDALIPSTPMGEISDASGQVAGVGLIVDINLIDPNTKQPRSVFDDEALSELAASIKEVGVMQPPVVRDLKNGRYELIMGERRLRASKLAGLTTIPVIIRNSGDNEMLREALLENIHRAALNPLEEGSAYQNLLNEFNYTHDELATKVGKSRSAVTNTLRLLNLPASVQRKVAAGIISAGHARSLLSLSDAHQIESLANKIVAEGLSVRATEELVALGNTGRVDQKIRPKTLQHPRVVEISSLLSDKLDTSVNIELGKSKGKITIEFADLEDLERISKLFN